MDDYFTTKIIKNIDSDENEIISLLYKIIISYDNDIELLNYYYCIPITSNPSVISIGKDYLEVEVTPTHAAVLFFQRQCLIKSNKFPHDLAAYCRVKHISKKTCQVLLGGFSYASIYADKRKSVRAEVEQPIDVTYSSQNSMLLGKLLDISYTGIGITSVDPLQEPDSSVGIIHMKLLLNPIKLSVGYISSYKMSSLWCHRFEIHPVAHTNKDIVQYIYYRQVEIIRRLKDDVSVLGFACN